MAYLETGAPGADELLFLPLGGTGEIGMNLNLYGHDGAWLMVDCGITFGDDTTPGIEVILPDPAFIEERKNDLVGIVLTHAHEDHLGALPYIWKRFPVPVYATPFTAAFLKRKLVETGLQDKVPIRIIPMSGRVHIAPFEIELITLTHSIPEPNAVFVRTPAGTVLHTGDWKLDPDPVVGETTDEKRLIEIGREGVLAMVCDSTNAMVPGHSGSEADVADVLADVFDRLDQRIVVGCFASNVARIESIAKAARAVGREVALVGRSLWRIHDAAKETGYLKDCPRFLSDDEAKRLPRDRVVLICTGSQGEPRAALTRIAEDQHPAISLQAGDAVIFSSREIPGNERAIGRLQNKLATLGVSIITARDEEIHVSGHPARDELSQMYQWVRPRISIPVHGEARHLKAHAELAKSCQIPFTLVARNGDVIRLDAQDGPEVIDEVYAGRLALDGKRLTAFDSDAIKGRRKLSFNGSVVVTAVVDGRGRLLKDPQLSAPGLAADEADELIDDLLDVVEDALEGAEGRKNIDDAALAEIIRRAVRRAAQELTGKRPPTDVHLVRI